MVWNNSPTERFPLQVAVSEDDCVSWPYSRVLANPGRQAAYPSAATAADGSIVIVYHEGPDKSRERWYYVRHVMAARVSPQWLLS